MKVNRSQEFEDKVYVDALLKVKKRLQYAYKNEQYKGRNLFTCNLMQRRPYFHKYKQELKEYSSIHNLDSQIPFSVNKVTDKTNDDDTVYEERMKFINYQINKFSKKPRAQKMSDTKLYKALKKEYSHKPEVFKQVAANLRPLYKKWVEVKTSGVRNNLFRESDAGFDTESLMVTFRWKVAQNEHGLPNLYWARVDIGQA